MDLYEQKTWFDLRHKVQLRVQYEQVKVLQDFQNFALVVAAALGGKSEGGVSSEEMEELAKKPPPKESTIMKFMQHAKATMTGETNG